MSDFEHDVDMESESELLGDGQGSDSESAPSASSSKSSSDSSSSSDDSSSSDEGADDLPAPAVIMLPEEKKLSEKLTSLENTKVDANDAETLPVTDVGYPLVDVMSDVLRLHELAPLADFKNYIKTGIKTARRAQLAGSEEGRDFENLPHDVLIHRMKLEVSKWKRRADVKMVKHSIERRWMDPLKAALCVARLRGLGMMASRDLEWVLRRRAAGELEDTDLGSADALVKFAARAWIIMDPRGSELEGSLLEGGVTSENLGLWLQQEDVLESLFRWRRLRRAGSELMDDADMVKKVVVQTVFDQPNSNVPVVEVSAPVAKVSMLRRKRI